QEPRLTGAGGQLEDGLARVGIDPVDDPLRQQTLAFEEPVAVALPRRRHLVADVLKEARLPGLVGHCATLTPVVLANVCVARGGISSARTGGGGPPTGRRGRGRAS